MDGLDDGLIDDPRLCTFDPTTDLPLCAGDGDAEDCFTTGQVEAIQKIYDGVRNSRGELLFPGQPLGAEIPGGWDLWIIGPASTILQEDLGAWNLNFDPPFPPGYDMATFDFDTDPVRMETRAELLNATNPNLEDLKQRGGKIIHYHGWADAGINPLMSINYYENVMKVMGEHNTKDFYRLYLIPGMLHCEGGIGCDTVDWLSLMMDWVENGIAPESVIGTSATSGRTRPLCPYPAAARYTGEGSIEDAENFTCATSEPASIGTGVQITGTATNIVSNLRAGDTVQFTVQALGNESVGTITYQFFTRAGYGLENWGNNTWTVVQDWSTVNTVSVPLNEAGLYFIAAHVERAGEPWDLGDPQTGIVVEVSAGQ
jgi:hypothetical protein